MLQRCSAPRGVLRATRRAHSPGRVDHSRGGILTHRHHRTPILNLRERSLQRPRQRVELSHVPREVFDFRILGGDLRGLSSERVSNTMRSPRSSARFSLEARALHSTRGSFHTRASWRGDCQWVCKFSHLVRRTERPEARVMFSERQLDGIECGPEQFFKRHNTKAPAQGGPQGGLWEQIRSSADFPGDPREVGSASE
jgi:hypothetical protein